MSLIKVELEQQAVDFTRSLAPELRQDSSASLRLEQGGAGSIQHLLRIKVVATSDIAGRIRLLRVHRVLRASPSSHHDS
jgi:hypothetical protein